MNLHDLSTSVANAFKVIQPQVIQTRLLRCQFLSQAIEGEVFLKLESEQHTGSFKARGSLFKVMSSLPTDQTFITASTGNHGAGFGRAMDITQQEGIVCLPTNADPSKVERIRSYPVQIIEHGDNPLETELFAKAHAEKNGHIYVSPYNDYHIIAGQGTIGVELLEQTNDIDHILITMGGGGLISGIGAYLKSSTSVNIVGCEPQHSMEMTLSLEAGKIIDQHDAKDTLSDGSAGGIEPNAITFPICQQVVDDTTVVEEAAIKEAISLVFHHENLVIEGAAAVTVASLLQNKERYRGKKVVLVICGGNIDPVKHASIVSKS